MEFPISFTGYCALFALLVVYYLYGASRLRAVLFFERIIEYLLQWALGGDQELKIGTSLSTSAPSPAVP
jgi:hypothetical protein